MTIRPALDEDRGALAEVDRLTWSPSVTPAAGPRAFGSVEGVLVAEGRGRVVGYVELGPATPLPSNAHVVEIRGLAVHPDHQRRGVARALLAGASDEARRRGATKLRLRVLGTNERAVALYRSAGFEREGTLRAEFIIDGRPVDDQLLARRL